MNNTATRTYQCPDCQGPIAVQVTGWWTHVDSLICSVAGWKLADDPFNVMDDDFGTDEEVAEYMQQFQI